MSTFSYRTKDGAIHDREYPVGKAPSEIEVDGKTAARYYGKSAASVPAAKGWPLTCVASGVHPDQAAELRQHFKDIGVPTEVTKGGDPVYRNASHRKRALRARGFYDKLSYG